jgi:hypothetical protein
MTAQRPQAGNPHGLLGYVLDDPKRTDNALRFVHWVVLALAIVAAAVVMLAMASPLAAAGLFGGGSIGGFALHRVYRQGRHPTG